MRVVEVSQYGDPEVLQVVERPEPPVGGGTVRVRQVATAVNPVDLWIRAGVMAGATPGLAPPFVIGFDVVGTVVEDAGGFRAGQVVAGQFPWLAQQGAQGSYAEVVAMDPSWLAPVPEGMDLDVAATLPLNALTARQGVDLLEVRAGASVVVTGASGAVGSFAVQLLARSGVSVVAVASAGDQDWVASLGAAHVVTRAEPEELVARVLRAVPAGVDAALDAALVGQPLLAAVTSGGRFVTVLGPAAPPAERDITITAVAAAPDSGQLAEVLQDTAAGRLRSRVLDVLPLEDAALAHQRTAAGGLRGKIVLRF